MLGPSVRGPGEDARRSTSILLFTIACAVSVQHPLQILSSVRAFKFRDRFGRARADEVSTAIAAFGAEVDDPIRRFDNFEIVLDDDDRAFRIDETAKSRKQFADIVEVQAGSRLIENVKHAGLAFGRVAVLCAVAGRARPRLQVRGQLHALRLASGERGRRLAKTQVAEADFIEHAQFFREPGNVGEELERFANGQVQDLVNVLALVTYFEHLRLVARALAFVADQFYVGQKLHFYGDRAVALAVVATSSGHIKRKMPGREAALLRFRQRSKKFADDIECLDVRNRIRARGASDGRLIDEHDLVEKLVAFDAVPQNSGSAAVRAIHLALGRSQRLIENVMQQ